MCTPLNVLPVIIQVFITLTTEASRLQLQNCVLPCDYQCNRLTTFADRYFEQKCKFKKKNTFATVGLCSSSSLLVEKKRFHNTVIDL